MASTFASNLRAWPLRRWVVAAVVAALAFVVVAIPTDLIPNPFFGREIPPTWWSHAALIISSALTGFLMATYVASPLAGPGSTNKSGVAASVLAFFAVGCPVCNKLVLLALGTSGAMTFFEPLQPLLAALSIGLLLWALLRRVSQENACRVPAASV
ncbi:hypothetical protein [Arthrobacter glacialis]|uniref:Uncharacterized protein n=1 Tax=Arthrobacter glacialis TaxID=1664 RepID=A0A2S3ZV44_ARTGL|nr:hypothetical protein [Arthrobacter glacialis]POH73090.1 hypothetical protein CVS27_13105 [Arthrobacter glacialis]